MSAVSCGFRNRKIPLNKNFVRWFDGLITGIKMRSECLNTETTIHHTEFVGVGNNISRAYNRKGFSVTTQIYLLTGGV